MKEWLELHTLHTDHVMTRSELEYLIAGKVVMLKCPVFGGKTGQLPMGRVCCVVRPIATVRIRVEPELETTREVGLVANTTCDWPRLLHHQIRSSE